MAGFDQNIDNPWFENLSALGAHSDILEQYTSETTSEPASDVSSEGSQRAGRHMLHDTKLLHSFTTVRNHTYVKKENLRICFFRGLRKCLKNIHRLSHMCPQINFVSSTSDIYTLNLLRSHYDQYQALIDSCLVKYPELGERSFNAKFFSRVLKSKEVRICMDLYLKFVLYDVTPNVAEKKLGFMCCPAANHDLKCSLKWEALKRFCIEELFNL